MWFDILKEGDLYRQRVMEMTKKDLESIFDSVILEDNTSSAYKLVPEAQENNRSFYIGADKTYNVVVLHLRFLYDVENSRFIYCNLFMGNGGEWTHIKLRDKYGLTDLIDVVKEFDKQILNLGTRLDFDKIFWRGYDVV